ncbi:hypothetical protein MBLNU13_g08875t3 [Cladosporium sp. NU13]
MADVDSSSNMNRYTSDTYEAPATTTTKKRGRKPQPDQPEKKSRLHERQGHSKLSGESNAEAQLLFGLIGRNHRHSKDFVQDLMALFTPLKVQVNEQWAEVEELMALCEKGVNMDARTALGFRDWVGHLSDEDEQKKARAYLSVVEVNSPIMVQVVRELIELFKPNDGSWAELRGIKDTFDQVDLDTESG